MTARDVVDGADREGRPIAAPSFWEGSWRVFDRWTPHVLLAVSTALSLGAPGQPLASRLVKLGLVVVAAAWIGLWHTRDPDILRDRHRLVPWYLAGLIVIAAALMAVDMIFFVFAISGFLHAYLLQPRPFVFVGTGATSFAILYFTWGGVPVADWEATVAFVSIFLIQTFLIGLGVVGSERLHELNEERRHTVAELEATLVENEGLHAQLVVQAREAGVHDERRRMAREIHDTLAQGLIGVITQLEAADQGRDDPQVLRRHLDNAATLARDSLAEARRSVQALGPGALEHDRLNDALNGIVQDWSELHRVPAELTVTGVPAPLAAEVEVGLVRVTQEALANAAKHAGASRVAVALSHLDDMVTLDVRDDGAGFDLAGVDHDGGFGITSMRQRVQVLGGELTIESELGAGTAVSASIPTRSVEEGAGDA